MSDDFKLPQLGPVQIVDMNSGRANNYLQSVWQQLTGKITGFFVDLSAIQAALASQQAQLTAQVLQIQNAQAAAAAAQSTANKAQTSADGGAVPTARSGEATAGVLLNTNGVWVVGPTVTLTTVTSPSDLTLPGTGPLGTGTTTSDVNCSGQYRITENSVDIGFVGTWSGVVADDAGNLTVSNESITAMTAYLSNRAAGGTVSYGLDFRRTFGFGITSFDGYLFARRS